MEIKYTFNTNKCEAKILSRVSMAQKRLDAQVIKDSNYFIPKDTGALERSVLGSILGSGVITWIIEYAKKMYHFGGKPSRETNPNASVKWFEKAKSMSTKNWVKVANVEYNK